jgi:hypothetical protein
VSERAGDDGPAAADDRHQALCLQKRERAMGGADRDGVSSGEFRERRQLIAGLQVAGADLLA